MNECTEYAKNIADDLERLYDGETVDECESLYDYIADTLDVEYTLDSGKNLIGVNLYVTLGGPTCWIDTRRQEVVCHWGTESGRWSISGRVCDEINEYFADVMQF